MDPLKAYFDAARSGSDRPWSPEARDAAWREIESRASRRTSLRRAWVGALAVAAVALAVIWSGRRHPPRLGPAPAVAVAPRPSLSAPSVPSLDVVLEPLGAASRYELAREASPEAMTVTLRAGGVRCTVPHRETRRFVVLAGDVRVEDRGTRFDVEVTDALVLVTVREGRVDVSSNRQVVGLGAGQSGRYPLWDTRASTPPPRPVVSVDALLAQADACMERDDDACAVALLRRVVREHRQHPRAQAAAMRLGRVLRDHRHPVEAADAYATAQAIAPRGAHAEAATFQEVSSLMSAGRRDLASERARRYAAERPGGLHVEAFRRQGLLP